MTTLKQQILDRFGPDVIIGLKAVILDRDGTINVPHPGIPGTENSGYLTRAEEFKFLPHAGEGIATMNKDGLAIHVFTQQSGIGKGLYTEQDLAAIHTKMCSDLSEQFGATIGDIEYCPHKSGCECKKPQPKMIADILERNDLVPHEVLVVGDSDRDKPTQEFLDQGMLFIAVPNPECDVKVEKLSKTDWEDMGEICACDLYELALALRDIRNS